MGTWISRLYHIFVNTMSPHHLTFSGHCSDIMHVSRHYIFKEHHFDITWRCHIDIKLWYLYDVTVMSNIKILLISKLGVRLSSYYDIYMISPLCQIWESYWYQTWESDCHHTMISIWYHHYVKYKNTIDITIGCQIDICMIGCYIRYITSHCGIYISPFFQIWIFYLYHNWMSN